MPRLRGQHRHGLHTGGHTGFALVSGHALTPGLESEGAHQLSDFLFTSSRIQGAHSVDDCQRKGFGGYLGHGLYNLNHEFRTSPNK